MNPLLDIVRRGWAAGLADFARVLPDYYRVAFLGTALRSGILRRLRASAATPAELAHDLGFDADLLEGLEAWLDLGVTIGELRRDGDRFGLRSRRSRRLAKASYDPLAAIYEEMVQLDHRLIAETPDRLRSGERFALTDADAGIVARSSRLGEPWLTASIEAAVPATGSVRLLEVGCGSGVHLRTACAANPDLMAVGLELQEPAAAQARANIASWGLAERVRIEVGDIRERPSDPSFDLVTLHQNIYYFPEPEQAAVLAHVRSFLTPGGRLLLTSAVRNAGVAASGLDLWGAMTAGAARLPRVDALAATLREAGYVDVTAQRPGIDGLYVAFTGTNPR